MKFLKFIIYSILFYTYSINTLHASDLNQSLLIDIDSLSDQESKTKAQSQHDSSRSASSAPAVQMHEYGTSESIGISISEPRSDALINNVPYSSSDAQSHKNQSSSHMAPSDSVVIDIVDETFNPLCLQIAKYNLAAIEKEKKLTECDLVENEEAQDPMFWFDYYTKPIIKPSEQDQFERAYNIIATAEKSKKIAWANKSIIDETTWNDLNILCGNREVPQEFLGSKLGNGNIKTKLGQAFFNGLIARPTDDPVILSQRQAIIKELSKNEKLYKEISEILKEIAKEEKYVTGLWGQEAIMQYFFKDAFFTQYKLKKYPRLRAIVNGLSAYANTSSFVLELNEIWQDLTKTWGALITTAMPIAFISFAIFYPYLAPEAAAEFTQYWMPASGFILGSLFTIQNSVVQHGSALCSGLDQGFNLPRDLKGLFASRVCFSDFLLKRMGAIARYFKAMKQLSEIVESNEILSQNLTYFKDMQSTLVQLPKENAEIKQLYDLFNSSTLSDDRTLTDESRSYLHNKGRVSCAYKLLTQNMKELLEPALTCIGEIDAYVATTKLLIDSQNSSNPYCLVDFVTYDTPVIELQDFWSPLCDRKPVITNSIQLGSFFKIPNVIVTGPNRSGKSTILIRGIATSVVLAQSLTIAPASKMQLTPISVLATFMNISDSTRESRYGEEVERSIKYGDLIDKFTKKKGFVCAFFDEICAGTSPEQAAKLGYCYGLEIAKNPNCLNIIATHYELLTHLEADTNGAYINYKIPVFITRNAITSVNEITRPHKIERGINTQHIAGDVWQELGSSSAFSSRLQKTISEFNQSQSQAVNSASSSAVS